MVEIHVQINTMTNELQEEEIYLSDTNRESEDLGVEVRVTDELLF